MHVGRHKIDTTYSTAYYNLIFGGYYVRVALAEFGIETRPLWKPMHLQPVFEGSEYVGFGVDEQLFKTGLCLPSASNMSIIEQSEVIERLITILRLS